jgi:hypothetical protein
MTISLRKLQLAFKNTLLGDEKISLRSHIEQNGLTPKQRIQIYQNNVFLTLTTALKNTYPTIHQILTEPSFLAIANHYIARYPSNFGNISSFGMHFGKFLTNFPAIKSLPYLKEIANLEWAYHEVFHEEEVEYFVLDKLKTVSAEKYSQIKFNLNPACRLLSGQYTILPIWQYYQQQKTPPFLPPLRAQDARCNPAPEREKILVIRRSLDITFEKLTEGEFALLSAFSKGLVFKQAHTLALKSDMTFNVGNYLRQAVLQKIIVDFYF